MTGSRSPRLVGYGASIDDECRVLVVGSMPSARSLQVQEYYGHPQNRFWTFMEELFGIAKALPHAERLVKLRAARVALWDVVQSCERETSADSKIREVQVNDFGALFRRYSGIIGVYCNGGKAHELWLRGVAPHLEPDLPVTRLPSTSPANASQSADSKLAAWSVLRDAVRGGPREAGFR